MPPTGTSDVDNFQQMFDNENFPIVTDDIMVIHWSEILLLLNPDVTTAWNIRKELIILGKILASDELRLCRLLLTRKPKSPEVFIHRYLAVNYPNEIKNS